MRRATTLAFTIACLTSPVAAQLALTPPQVEGPYYPTTKPAEVDGDLTRLGDGPIAKGDILVLEGRVLDPSGQPIDGARIEIWQTDAKGIYLHPGDGRTAQRDRAFQFYGEARSQRDGGFAFRTIFPGLYTGRPRHIHAKVTPPGGRTLTTQFYFANDGDARSDPILRRAGTAGASLLLAPKALPDGTSRAEVTIVVQRAPR